MLEQILIGEGIRRTRVLVREVDFAFMQLRQVPYTR
jgi:hypothetical protein